MKAKNKQLKLKNIELIARIGVFGTFIGHGIMAFNINPKWIPLLSSVGFSEKQAILLMPIIGIMDIIVATLSLFYPIRIILLWATTWAFLTALSRPFSGEPMLELIERSANWCLPLTLLILQGFPKNYIAIFRIREE
jgi:hypothetical protein